MKTAIALFGTRISPRFDCAQDFMLITIDKQKILHKETETIADKPSLIKIKRLIDLQVKTVICGGIDLTSREYLRSHKIHVLPNVTGEAEDALCAFINGTLKPAPCHSPLSLPPADR